MSSKSIIDKLESILKSTSTKSTRRGRRMIESIGVQASFSSSMIRSIHFRQDEYSQYREMIDDQIPLFQRRLQEDKFGRRLLIQFPSNWYESKPQNYMPCPESFLVQYIDDSSYDIVLNERSTEYTRAPEDLSIILYMCEVDLQLEGSSRFVHVHYMNLHKYLDGGTSEDFDANSGYYAQKS